MNDYKETYFWAQQGSCTYELTVVMTSSTDMEKLKPGKTSWKWEVGEVKQEVSSWRVTGD